MDGDRIKRLLCNYINIFDYKGVDNLSYILRQTLDLIQKQEKEIEKIKELIKFKQYQVNYTADDISVQDIIDDLKKIIGE